MGSEHQDASLEDLASKDQSFSDLIWSKTSKEKAYDMEKMNRTQN